MAADDARSPNQQHQPDAQATWKPGHVERVPLSALRAGPSPRRSLDSAHADVLVSVLDRVPPILVHRDTMTVIDGAHRCEASRRAAISDIAVEFFDGSADEAFVLAITANQAHGLPLKLAERRHAAHALLERFPDWSDRMIAEACGMSHTTVGAVRTKFADKTASDQARVGRDGRRRRQPSVGRPHPAQSASAVERSKPAPPVGQETSRIGRAVAERTREWLEQASVDIDDVTALANDVPLGHVYELADECRRRSSAWLALADALEQRARGSRQDSA